MNPKALAAGAFVSALLVHLSGALRAMEHEVSPGLARTTFGWLGHSVDEGRPAAKAAIQEMINGSSGDRIAARAACALLNSSIPGTPAHEQWVEIIYQDIPPGQRGAPGVDRAVDTLATRLAGVTEYHRLYTEACFGRR